MGDRCEFCGRDPFERVDVGFGSPGVAVAVTCCELGVSVYDHRNDADAEMTVSVAELRKIAGTISGLRWQVERRDRTLGKLWRRRALPRK